MLQPRVGSVALVFSLLLGVTACAIADDPKVGGASSSYGPTTAETGSVTLRPSRDFLIQGSPPLAKADTAELLVVARDWKAIADGYDRPPVAGIDWNTVRSSATEMRISAGVVPRRVVMNETEMVDSEGIPREEAMISSVCTEVSPDVDERPDNDRCIYWRDLGGRDIIVRPTALTAPYIVIQAMWYAELFETRPPAEVASSWAWFRA